MKTWIPFKISLLVGIILIQYPTFAQNELKKHISKTYTSSKNTQLYITNMHGNIDVNTWDKNKITVDVTITTKGRKAREMMDKIHIDHNQSENEIIFKTDIEPMNNCQRTYMKINYKVNMPSKNALEIYNKYGNVFLDDFQGKLDMEIRYGKFVGSHLRGDRKKITIAYGGLDIEELERGKVSSSYSGGDIKKSGDVLLKNKYGVMKFGTINKLDMETKYGGINIYEEVNDIKGELSYSKFSVNKLLKNLAMEVRYAGGFTVSEVSKELEEINIDGSYSTFNLTFAKDANFDFNIITRYGGFNNSVSNRTSLKKDLQRGQTSQFEGQVGKKKGGNVRIDVRYGSVRFR